MKNRDLARTAALGFLLAGFTPALPTAHASPFVYESEKELVSTGDFDGDGREDVIIVDKETGKYRLGYQQANGLFNWVNFRPGGMKYVSSLSTGKLLGTDRDAIALASADGNQLLVWDARNPGSPGSSLPVPFGGLGPNSAVAIDIGGDGNTPLQDLFVTSMYNSDPSPNRIALMRATGTQFSRMAELPLSGTLTHGNRVTLNGGAEVLGGIVSGDDGDAFRVEDLSSGKPVTVASVTGIPSGSDFVFGTFRGAPARDFSSINRARASCCFVRSRKPAGASSSLERATRSTWVNRSGSSTPWRRATPPSCWPSSAKATRPPSTISTEAKLPPCPRP